MRLRRPDPGPYPHDGDTEAVREWFERVAAPTAIERPFIALGEWGRRNDRAFVHGPAWRVKWLTLGSGVRLLALVVLIGLTSLLVAEPVSWAATALAIPVTALAGWGTFTGLRSSMAYRGGYEESRAAMTKAVLDYANETDDEALRLWAVRNDFEQRPKTL